MATRTRPLMGRSLRRWRAAEAEVRASQPETPEHEEALLCASDAQWRYLDLLRQSRDRLDSVSRQVIATCRELRTMELRRSALARGSREELEAARDVRALSAALVDLATEEELIGLTIGLSRDSTAEPVRRDRPPGSQAEA